MPTYYIQVSRTQHFITKITADSEEDLKNIVEADNDSIDELVHDHPYNVDHTDWKLDTYTIVHS